MTTACNCALCEKPFSIVGDSDEHIIPNSIGGRRKIRSFICTGCNCRAGETWDAEIWRQFCLIASMHGIERERGDIPAIPVRTAAGKQLKLLPDGSLTLRKIIFEKVPHSQGGGSVINAAVRTMEEAKSMAKSVAANYPSVNVQEVLSKVRSNSEFLDSPLTFSASFGGPLGGRSMVKTAIAMALAAGIRPSACDLALPYLLNENSGAPYGLFYARDLVSERPASYTPHIVSVYGDPRSGYLWGYVEYFGLARIVVPLSERYDGRAISSTYAFNPANGKEIAIGVDLSFSDEEIERIKANKAYSDEQYVTIANASFGIVYFRNVRRQFRMAFAESIAHAASKLGIAHGEAIPPEQAAKFSEYMVEKLGPLLAHLYSNGIPLAEAMRIDDVD
jgi:hypothetical protein